MDHDVGLLARLVLMQNLRSPFFRVGPPCTWEARAVHLWRTVRQQLETPLGADEFVRSPLR